MAQLSRGKIEKSKEIEGEEMGARAGRGSGEKNFN